MPMLRFKRHSARVVNEIMGREAARQVRPHRFPHTSCSQCGCEFGSGNWGFSECDTHITIAREKRAQEKRRDFDVKAGT